jgi:hypothetical protein
MKKIIIIAPSSFGYINFLVEALDKNPNVEVVHINFSNFKYNYTSKFDKLTNAIQKSLFRKNIKDAYRSQRILETVYDKEQQDIIVVIRPDQIELKTLLKLKNKTQKFYAFYFDAIANFPKQIDFIPLFDTVFSYEKEDAKTYGLEFITNYIYRSKTLQNNHATPRVFNISSYDERFGQLKSIALYLKDHDIPSEIIVRKERPIQDDLVTIVSEYMTLEEVERHILDADILLDIQKGHQKGLSFRVFEALGFEKKLLTTNSDVINYDFYNPNNILVINPKNIEIPELFLSTSYQQIPETILYPYTLKGWIERIFEV